MGPSWSVDRQNQDIGEISPSTERSNRKGRSWAEKRVLAVDRPFDHPRSPDPTGRESFEQLPTPDTLRTVARSPDTRAVANLHARIIEPPSVEKKTGHQE